MHTISSVLSTVKRGDYAFKKDLQDAYFHVLILFCTRFTIFTDASTQDWGDHMWDSQIAGVWTLSEHELHINVLELRAVILALHHWATVLQGRHVLIATDNTTVVAYINKQGGTHSHPLLRLVVDLFLWLQTQNRHMLKCESRPVVSTEPAHHDRVE